MVHRPTDSRLLSNLLTHERDYTKQLLSLLDSASHASLSSFAAYASASPPTVSRAVVAVAGSLAGADDALRRYAQSVDAWREHLTRLKDLEDDVGNIMRDREILVTRLIKASKHQKPTRDSFIANIGPSPSSMSQSSLSSSNSTSPASSKLSAAQAELQACETHLATKERELDAMRVSAVRQGLYVRCTAMVECGWTWGEMGKEGLRALEGMDMSNSHANDMHKPLPDPMHHPLGSDMSSLGPSQSASQIALPLENGFAEHGSMRAASPSSHRASEENERYTLHIEPAHSISEFVLPQRIGMERRITEEDEPPDGSSSSENGEAGPLQVVENARFAQAGPEASGRSALPRRFTLRSHQRRGSGSSVSERPPIPQRGDSNGMMSSVSEPQVAMPRERKTSGIFGSIAGLFRSGQKGDNGRWKTRTEKNLKQARKGESDSEDEAPQRRMPFTRRASEEETVRRRPQANGSPVGQRLRKRSLRRAPDANTSAAENGWASEGGLAMGSRTRKGKGRAETSPTPEVPALPSPMTHKTKVGRTQSMSQAGPSTLSRNSSLSRTSGMSASSAPPLATNVLRRASPASAPPVEHPPGGGITASQSTGAVNRSASTARKRASAPPSSKAATWTGSHPHPQSSAHTHARAALSNGQPGQPSLMSIVEGVTRANRDGWAAHTREVDLSPASSPGASPGGGGLVGGLVGVKAPPPLKDYNLRGEGGKGLAFESVVAPPPLTGPGSAGTNAKVEVPKSLELARPTPIPAKMPLRSALKSPSRTPSPMRAPPVHRVPQHSSPQPRSSSSKAIEQVSPDKEDDDASSISSYETGHEVFDDEPEPEVPPPPPEKSGPRSTGSDVSSSTLTAFGNANGTANGGADSIAPPVRRKSVRMSLQPTFSPTPPAVEDDDDGQLWNGPRTSNGKAHPEVGDLWVDSSDEDEEYSRAKTALRRVSKKKW